MARKVTNNDDAPQITAELFTKMKPMADVDPGMVAAIKAARGRPRVENPKAVISLRLSAPAKSAWDSLPREKRGKLVAAMERGAIQAAHNLVARRKPPAIPRPARKRSA